MNNQTAERFSAIGQQEAPQGIDLARVLDNHIKRQRFYLRNEGDGFYHPSESSVETVNAYGEREVLGACARKVYLRVVGGYERADESGDTYVAWTTHHGSQIEKMVTELCKQAGIWVDSSVPFYNKEHNVKGEVDIVIQEPGFDKPTIVECKSYYSYEATKHIMGSKRPPTRGRPKDNHLLQTAVYLYFFRDQVARAKIFYFARDSSKHREFNLTLHEDSGVFRIAVDGRMEERFTINDILARLKTIDSFVKAGEVPPRDFEIAWDAAKVELERARGNISDTKYSDWEKGKRTIGDWTCAYCPFRGPCYGQELSQISEDTE